MGSDLNDPQIGDAKPTVVVVPSTSMTLTGGTGDGGVIQTPAGQPNIIIKPVSPLVIIAVRAARVFGQTMLGIVTAGPVTGLIPAHDFGHLMVTAASLSVGSAVICILQNGVELLGRFDQSHPTLAG